MAFYLKHVPVRQPIVAILWLLNLVAIPFFSFHGRVFQRSLAESIGRSGIAWLLGSSIILLVVIAAVMLVKKIGFMGLIHLFWIMLIASAIMLYVRNNPERWYHIPLFGMFGYLSVSLFSFRTGTEIAAAMAVIDETVQHYLPERVGDFEDVIINVVCAALGVMLYAILERPVSADRRRISFNE